MSLATLFSLSLALHLYIGARLVPVLGEVSGPLLALVLAFSSVALPLGLVARRIARPPAADTLAWIGMVFMGLFSSLFVLTLARELVLLVNAFTFANAAAREASARAVPVLALLITLFGFWNARRPAQVVTVEVPIDGLPGEFDGFRIVQISDIHVGPTIKQPYLAAIVDKVNSLAPDIVAVTGDLVDGTVAELAPHVAPLSRLAGREGNYFVTGNHEYYSGVDPWLHELRRLGLRVLMNEHVLITRGETRLVIAGVPDYTAGRFDTSHASDPKRALGNAPTSARRVLLAHQPRTAPAAAEAGFDLQISGHTHGGQFLPWNLFVPLQQPYTAGLHRLGKLWIYVSRGTGYWGPPKRVGAPSEITLLLLKAK